MSTRTAAGDELLPFLQTTRVVRTGVAIVVLFIVIFLGWAAFAPLESAMITSGIVVTNAGHEGAGISIAIRVPAEDADEVSPGLTAKVDMSANKVRRLPMLTGIVIWVSQGSVQDSRTGQAYFLARLSLDRASLAAFPARMLPGMPVRVEIPTGAHTALEYLIAPITDVMRNGMREK